MTYDVLAIGRSSIDLYAHEIGRPMADVRSFDAYVGGCPTNVSVGTRRLGLRSALLTAVGGEGFRMLREALTTAWEQHGRGRPAGKLPKRRSAVRRENTRENKRAVRCVRSVPRGGTMSLKQAIHHPTAHC